MEHFRLVGRIFCPWSTFVYVKHCTILPHIQNISGGNSSLLPLGKQGKASNQRRAAPSTPYIRHSFCHSQDQSFRTRPLRPSFINPAHLDSMGAPLV